MLNNDLTHITRSAIATAGLVDHAEQKRCFWLLDLYASHLISIDTQLEWFTCLKMTVNEYAATIRIEDGNNNVYSKQYVDFTDYEDAELMLFACWNGESWVMMLPNEY